MAAEVPVPALEGPIPGQAFVAATAFDLAEVGYTQEEYFISGIARAYLPDGPLDNDGFWSVSEGASAHPPALRRKARLARDRLCLIADSVLLKIEREKHRKPLQLSHLHLR